MQFRDRHRLTAAVLRFVPNTLDQRMSGQKFREPSSQRARSISMNDAHGRPPGQSRIVDEFIDQLGRFLHSPSNNVNLAATRCADFRLGRISSRA